MVLDASRQNVSQLPLHVDGIPLVGASEMQYAIHAAVETLPDNDVLLLAALRKEHVIVLSSFFDPVDELLDALGIRWSAAAAEDLALLDATIAVAGCPHRHMRLDRRDVEVFLGRGGVLISSDRAALTTGLAPYVRVGPGRGPSRARVVTSCEDRDPRLPQSLLPAIWLDPGHQPLAKPVRDAADVLAFDALTGSPLATVECIGDGAIVHSVAHWMQNSPTMTPTGFESQRLASVPAYAVIGNSYPQLSLGAYLSATVMVRLLLAGLRRTPWAGRAETPVLGQEEGS